MGIYLLSSSKVLLRERERERESAKAIKYTLQEVGGVSAGSELGGIRAVPKLKNWASSFYRK
jgi:hypothetical protein